MHKCTKWGRLQNSRYCAIRVLFGVLTLLYCSYSRTRRLTTSHDQITLLFEGRVSSALVDTGPFSVNVTLYAKSVTSDGDKLFATSPLTISGVT